MGKDSVRIIAETPSRTMAPPGMGLTIEPTIVETKMASRSHDFRSMPLGIGSNQTMRPTRTTIAHLIRRVRYENRYGSAG
jgi:hypothetical protein